MVGTLVASAILGAAAAGTFAYAATVFAVNFALSMIVTRVFGDNPETQQDMGVRQQVPPSAVNAIPIVYGSAYMGGTFVDAVLTEDQKTMYYVLAISCISPNGQFSFNTADMYYGDRLITFGTGADSTKVLALTDEAGNVNNKISGNLYISLYTSTAGGTIVSANGADAPSVVMGGSDIAVGQRWPASNRQMNGLAFAIVKLVYNRDADTTQLSPITFNVNHYLNSTGTAKPGDVWKDYITSTVYGGAVNLSFVDTASATALNAYSDELITFKNSSGVPSTQSRYRINGVLDAGQTVLSNLDRIMSASDSWMTYNAALGQWSIVINKAETASYAFTDNNIIGEIRVSATDITSSINQVEARFPFKENRDQAAFVNIKTPTGLLYPNEPVNKYSITYDLVNDSVQTGYLANRLLEQAREDLIVSFSTTYYGIQVDAGNVVSVTNTDYGWNSKLFRVMKVNEASLPDGSLGAKLELSEYNAQVYDDLDITAFTPVPNSGLPSVSYFSPLSAPTVTGYPSATIPNFSVTVFVPTTGRVTFGNLFFTTSATPTAGDWQLLTSASTANNQPVTNNTYYTYTNLTLNTGTYYFAYQVGNEISNSVISPISAAFVWNPVAGLGPTGPTGSTGGSGDSVDIIFKRSATQPTTPAPSVGTPATWYSDVNSVPAGADPIWSSVGTNTGTGTVYTWQTPLLIEGQNGTDGLSVAELLIYIRATSTPATPTGGSYNFTTQTLTAPAGWYSFVPTGTDPVYTSRSVASVSGTTGTDTTLTWTTPTLSFQNGATGPTGASVTGPTGLAGLTALTAYKVQSQSAAAPTFTTPTSGATAPSGWSLTTPAITIGQVMWYIQGRYNSNSVTVDGVAAGTTAWTGPVAASVFQDLRSDNWDGANPPTYGTPSTYGTVGYYIRQGNTSGSPSAIYINEGIFSGDISTGGDAVFSGKNPATQTVIVGGVVYGIDYTTYAEARTQPSLNTARVGHFGYAQAQSNAGVGYITYNVGVLGIGKNYFGSKGIGVVGEGDQTGGYFNGTEYGVIANSDGITPRSLAVTDGTYFRWGLFDVITPGGTTTKFLRDDGTWQIPPGGGGTGTVTSVSGTGSVSGLTLSGTVTTSGNLTLGGTLSLTSGNVTTALGYTPLASAVTSVGGTGSVSGLSLSGTVTSTGNLTLGGTLSVTQANLIASAPGTTFYLAGSGWTSTSPVMSLAGTNSGTATVASNTLNILGSTGTGIVGAYVGTTGSGNTVTLDIRTTSPSDLRLKDEIKDIDLGLAFVNKLRPVSYKLKADPKRQKGYGLIADEVEEHTEADTSLVYFEPDWKVGNETGFKTIHYPSYVAVLIKAVQELSAKVEALEARLKG